MKVIETFVTSVPRNEIHPDAEFFTQDRDDGSFSQFSEEPSTKGYYWYGNRYEGSLGRNSVSDAADRTIITREELMKAYDLVDQGYTLWFGGDCPVEKGVFVDVIYRNGTVSTSLPANEDYSTERDASIAFWRNDENSNDIIAYRLSEAEDKSSSLAPLSEENIKAIKANINRFGSRPWKADHNSVAIDPESGDYECAGNNLVVITKDEWNTYLDSVKVEVGDTVSFIHSDVFYEVLYVGKEKAFIKDSDGTEYSFPLEELSKVVK